MSNMVTRCPKCATSFRITSAQLQSAKGAVRCGSCLHIFKAQEHLVGGSTTSPANTTATKPVIAPAKAIATKPVENATREAAKPKPLTPPAPTTTTAATKPAENSPPSKASSAPSPAARTQQSPANSLEQQRSVEQQKSGEHQRSVEQKKSGEQRRSGDQKLPFNQDEINRELAMSGDDDFLISDDMDEPDKPEKNDYEFDGFLDIEKLPKQTASLFEREVRIKEPEKDDIDPDEAWAMELLDEADDETHTSSNESRSAREFVDEDEEAFRAHERLSDNDRYNEEQEDEPEHGDQQTAPSDTYTSSSHYKGPVFNIVAEKHDDMDESEEIHAQPYNDNHLYQQALNKGKDDSHMRAFDTSRAALLMNIMPEPVEMTARRDRKLAAKRLWGGLSLLLVFVLFVQIAWLQFDNLNRTEPYRSFYGSVCSVLGCTLPTLVDRSKIRAYNLVVRNHPKLENALIVDAILLNNASFQQPFPDLILAFSTIDDTPVASRRFKPQEYLRGELAGKSLMPQNQPIHLTLELVDPGSEAVNYHAYIPE